MLLGWVVLCGSADNCCGFVIIVVHSSSCCSLLPATTSFCAYSHLLHYKHSPPLSARIPGSSFICPTIHRADVWTESRAGTSWPATMLVTG